MALLPPYPLDESSDATEPESCLTRLLEPAYWDEYLAFHAERHPRRTQAREEFQILTRKRQELASSVLECRYLPGIPRQVLLNRLDGRRKRLVYVYPRQDELVMKLCCRLTGRYDALLPEGCHAFRPGRSARTAFSSLTHHGGLTRFSCIRLDITDFFNAIPSDRALAFLPAVMRADKPLFSLFHDIIQPQSTDSDTCENRGVQPGTPIAPLLANHYLASFDRRWMATGWPYARYSDDIILFVPPDRMKETLQDMRADLVALGLSLNHSKSHVHAPGEAWEFLGFQYNAGRIDLCDAAVRKIKNRIRRLARRLNRYRIRREVPQEKILQYFFRRLNGRLFGYEGRDGRFCWSRWYMPLLNTSATLKVLDAFIGDQARYACTGRIRLADRRHIPREKLQQAGYRTLVSFFYAREWQFKRTGGTLQPPSPR